MSDRPPGFSALEAALMQRIGLSHEDIRCDLVFGAAEFPERREQNEEVLQGTRTPHHASDPQTVK